MIKAMKLAWMLSAIAALTAPLAACNTVEGVGEDVEAAGGAVEESARENRGY